MTKKQQKRRAREWWIMFFRFHEVVLEVQHGETREGIAKQFNVKNPDSNLIKVREVRGK